MSAGRNRKLVVFYGLIGIAIISLATLGTLKLIYNLWFPPFFDLKEKAVAVEIIQMSNLSKELRADGKTVIFRNIETYSDGNNFHKIMTDIRKDNKDLCVTCHGNVPHFIDIERRAFLNKHSLYLSCESCHIEKNSSNIFTWYNVNDGSLTKSLTIDQPILITDTKIGLISKDSSLYDEAPRIADAKTLLAKADAMTKNERAEALKPFHKNNFTDTKKTTTCASCHTTSSVSYLPFAELGYTDDRTRRILSSDVVQMVLKYKEFFIPTIVTGNGDEK